MTVTCLMPGATETEFFERADMMDTKVGTAKKDDPAEVAKTGFDAMMRGDGDVVSGLEEQAAGGHRAHHAGGRARRAAPANGGAGHGQEVGRAPDPVARRARFGAVRPSWGNNDDDFGYPVKRGNGEGDRALSRRTRGGLVAVASDVACLPLALVNVYFHGAPAPATAPGW